MAQATIKLQLEDGVAHIVFSNAERANALSVAMLDRLPDLLREVEANDGVRCIVLRGEGDRHFCSGGDISGMGAGGPLDEAALAERIAYWASASQILYEMEKPSLAVINGSASGAGLCLAMACDLRLAAQSARLSTAFSAVALPGDFGGSWLLPRLVGGAKARELYLLSPRLEATEARDIGLVNWLSPAAELDARAEALARQLAAGPVQAFAAIKANFHLAEAGSLAEVIAAEAQATARCALGEEVAAAMAGLYKKD